MEQTSERLQQQLVVIVNDIEGRVREMETKRVRPTTVPKKLVGKIAVLIVPSIKVVIFRRKMSEVLFLGITRDRKQ